MPVVMWMLGAAVHHSIAEKGSTRGFLQRKGRREYVDGFVIPGLVGNLFV